MRFATNEISTEPVYHQRVNAYSREDMRRSSQLIPSVVLVYWQVSQCLKCRHPMNTFIKERQTSEICCFHIALRRMQISDRNGVRTFEAPLSLDGGPGLDEILG